jgi:signal recognition particle subunit SRP54
MSAHAAACAAGERVERHEMFESLSDRLQNVLGELRSHGKLSEADIDKAMREIRLALLEADVNFKVVREFVKHVKERALGQDVLESLTPGQQVVKIVNEELTELMGAGDSKLAFSGHSPTIILMAGLQGSGKTTTCAKLARFLQREGKRPVLIAADVYRPAAIDQLVTLAERVNVPVYAPGADVDPVVIARDGVEFARLHGDVAIIDTAGRLHVDDVLMEELARIRKEVKPHNILLVVDAMTGQDAVNAADQFKERVNIDGVVLTKLDGDARGGAALSVRAVTGKPIKFASTGEKLDDFDYFHPDRMAGRILGMGDVLSLIEKAQEGVDEKQAAAMEARLRRAEFTFEDFLEQMKQIRKMGSLSSIIGMLPGVPGIKQLKNAQVDDKQLDRIEAMIFSMTPQERRHPDIIDGSRRQRIARGSGTHVQDINQLLKQFREMQKMMKQLAGAKPGRMGLPGIGR